MCGITGFWDFKNQLSKSDRQSIIQNMTTEIKSRGPDGDGFWVDKDTSFTVGHRRLSIIDLSTHASQPMVSASGRFVISYNGEVYNFQDIRHDLLQKGVSFKTHSDTEVVLEACALYGVPKAAEKFNGMFAFSLWDRQEKKVYLVRDRLGIKPLYWGIHNHVLFFGSQLKSFRKHPSWRPQLNEKALSLYFRYKYVPAPLSIYEDIFKLEPGHIVTIDPSQKIQKEGFWDLKSFAMQNQSDSAPVPSQKEALENLEELLTDSIKRILVSDVPIGCFLSGGIDSSLVATLMQSLSSQPIQTFSIGFENQTYNEAPQARRVADFLKTNHHEEILTEKKCLQVIPDLATFYDEPFADSSQIPTYLVSALAKRSVTVVLSGDGGDELFGGYNRYKVAQRFWEKLSHLPPTFRSTGAYALNSIPLGFLEGLNKILPKNFSYTGIGNKIEKLSKIIEASSQKDFYEALTTQSVHLKDLLASPYDAMLPLESLKNRSFVEQMQYWDMKTYLPDDILAKVDRASMAVGLEARVPFLDHRLVEMSWRLPLAFKIKGGETKWILRQLLSKKLPHTLFAGPKKGFAVPISEWLKGPLKEWASDIISSETSHIIQKNHIQHLWQEHLAGTHDRHEVLWSYLMYRQWEETYS